MPLVWASEAERGENNCFLTNILLGKVPSSWSQDARISAFKRFQTMLYYVTCCILLALEAGLVLQVPSALMQPRLLATLRGDYVGKDETSMANTFQEENHLTNAGLSKSQ